MLKLPSIPLLEEIKQNKNIPELAILGLKTDLDDYQRQGIVFMYQAGRCMLADEGGLGKTLSALGLFLLLRSIGEGRRCVVVTLSTSVLSTWREEILHHTDLNPIVVLGEKLQGPRARDAAYSQLSDRCPILITNYEIFRRDYKHRVFRSVDLLIFDESSYFKNYDTSTAEVVRAVSKYVPRVVLLNATPIENSVMDFYSQAEVLYPGLLGTYREFKSRYAVEKLIPIEKWDPRARRKVMMEVPKIVGAQNMDELKQRAGWMVLRREPGDVGIKYPEPVFKDVWLEMNPDQREFYETLRKGILQRGNKIRNVAFATKYGYMLLTCTFPSLVKKEGYVPGESPKADFTIDFARKLRDAGEQLVIFSRFRMTVVLLERILEEAGLRVATITGRESKAERAQNQENFNRGKEDVLIINLAGNRSLNLQAARYMLFLDMCFNPSMNKQAWLRLCRRTQESDKIYVFNLVMQQSAEMHLMDVLAGRTAVAKDFWEKPVIRLAEMKEAFRAEAAELGDVWHVE